MNNNVVKFCSINLGDVDSDGDVIYNLALGAVDVVSGAPISDRGNIDYSTANEAESGVFLADGSLLDISDIPSSLLFTKTSATLTISSADLNFLSDINSYKYRNKPINIYIGIRGADGSLDSYENIFSGFCDSHKVTKTNIKLKAQSVWARFEQYSSSAPGSGSQNAKIREGVFDVSDTVTDKGFDFIDRDYSNIVFSGRVETTTVTRGPRKYGFFGPKSKSYNTIPGQPGNSVGGSNTAFTASLAYGTANVVPQLLHVFNPVQEDIDRLTGMRGDRNEHDEELSPDESKYITLVFAVTHGVVDTMVMNIKGLMFPEAGDAGETLDMQVIIVNGETPTARLASEGASSILSLLLADNTVNDHPLTHMFIESNNGAYDQEALPVTVGLDPNGDWTDEHRCLGYVLCSVTLVSSTFFGGQIPDITFDVKGVRQGDITTTEGDNGTEYSYAKGEKNVQIGEVSERSSRRIAARCSHRSTGEYNTLFANNLHILLNDSGHSPALAILDFLTNKLYGIGIGVESINLASFKQAQDMENLTGESYLGDYPMRCRGIFEGTQTIKSIIDSLLVVAKSNITWIDGKIVLVRNSYVSTDEEMKAALRLNEDDYVNEDLILRGFDSLDFGASATAYNQVDLSTSVVGDEESGGVYGVTILDTNAFIEDNYQKSSLALDLNMASVVYYPEAYKETRTDEQLEVINSSQGIYPQGLENLIELGRIRLRNSRLFITGSFKVDYFTHKNWKAGDIKLLSNKRFLLTGDAEKLIKITKLTYLGLGQISVKWKEFSNLIYDSEDADITSISRTSGAPARFNIPTAVVDSSIVPVNAPSGLSVEISTILGLSGRLQTSVTLLWTADNAASVVYYVEYKLSVSGAWVSGGSSNNLAVILPNLQAGTYDFRVRAISPSAAISEYDTVSEVFIEKIIYSAPDPSALIGIISANILELTWALPVVPGLPAEPTEDEQNAYFGTIDFNTEGFVQIRFNPAQTAVTWENSIVLIPRIVMPSSNVSVPPYDGTYLIRFFNSAGIGIGFSSYVSNTGSAASTRRVTYEETPLFTGDNQGTASVVDGSLVADGRLITYDFSNVVDLLSMRVATIGVRYLLSTETSASTICDAGQICLATDICTGNENQASIQFEFSTTDGNPNGAGSQAPVWTDYSPFIQTVINARGVRVRIKVDSGANNVITEIQELSLFLDVENLTKRGFTNTPITGTEVVVFDVPFFATSDSVLLPVITAVVVDGTAGDTVVLSDLSLNSFSVAVYNSSNVQVDGRVSWTASIG